MRVGALAIGSIYNRLCGVKTHVSDYCLAGCPLTQQTRECTYRNPLYLLKTLLTLGVSGRRLSNVRLTLYGPVQRPETLIWLVPSGFSLVLDSLRERNFQRISTQNVYGDRIQIHSDMTLDELYEAAASKNENRLARWLEDWKVAQIKAYRVPIGFHVEYFVGGFQPPEIFWRWVDGLEELMRDQGFERAESRAKPEFDTHPDVLKLDPDLRERRRKVIDLKQKRFPDKKIAIMVRTRVGNVKADAHWARCRGLLESQ